MTTDISRAGIVRTVGKFIPSLMNSVSDAAKSKIQSEVFAEFSELCGQYTMRSSGSLSREKSQMIMDSVIYTADSFLISLSDDAALDMLVNTPFHEIYVKGTAVIDRAIAEGKTFCKAAYSHRLNIQTGSYRYICEKGYDEFLSHIKEIRFDCKNVFISIDYPLLTPISDIEGVWFLREFYRRLAMENILCEGLGEEKITAALKNYGRYCGMDYTLLFDNICGLFLDNMLWCALSEHEDITLPFDFDAMSGLRDRISGMESDERYRIFASSYSRCCALIRIGSDNSYFTDALSERLSAIDKSIGISYH